MRLIDADALHFNRIRTAHEDGTVGGYNAVVMSAEIKDAPTIDAVPVVRCKDCKYWDKTWRNDWSPDYHYCPMTDGVRKGIFYCAYAERSEDGEN